MFRIRDVLIWSYFITYCSSFKSVFKDNGYQEVTNPIEIQIFLIFFLMMEGSGSGSGSVQKLRFRIREAQKFTYLDPEHFIVCSAYPTCTVIDWPRDRTSHAEHDKIVQVKARATIRRRDIDTLWSYRSEKVKMLCILTRTSKYLRLGNSGYAI